MMLVAAALFGVVGCGSGDKSNEATSPNGSPSAQGGKTFTIAVIPKGATHEYWKSIHEGANEAAAEVGAKVNWITPTKEDDRDAQTKIVENAINSKVDGIVLAPLDNKALTPSVNEAIKAKIPVVIIDSSLDGAKTVSYIATDNEKGGKMAAQEMAKVLGDKGKIVVLRYAVGSASTELREKGFIDEITNNHKGIQILDASQYGAPTVESAQKKGESLLGRFKKPDGTLDLDGIYTPNESTTFGMLRVLQDNKWAGKVKFIGFDISDKLKTGVESGEINGLIVQNPRKMGYEGVKTIVSYLKGAKDIKPVIDTGATLITKENINSDDNKKLLAPPKV